MIAGRGDELPVSALPIDGTYPTGTTKWEKRNLAVDIPVWEPSICIQCGKCAMVCPHGVIRIKAYDPVHLEGAPLTFKAMEARDREWQGLRYTIQVSPEDCTGCGICVEVCPAKSKSETRLKALNMQPQPPLREPERENWEFFEAIPDMDRREIKVSAIRQQQVQQPLFEPPTSSSSPSFSATGSWLPTPPGALRFTAAICPPRPGQPMPMGVVRPGPIRSSRTMLSSASASASPSTSNGPSLTSC
jgi:ferredoxin